MANARKNKPKYFDDGPSAMEDSRAMDDSSTILQLFRKADKRVLRLFDAKQYDNNNGDENHSFGIEVLNKSDSETENDGNDENDKENDDIEIPESQEPEATQPQSPYQQSRRDGIKSLNVKNLSPIDICTISSEGSNSRSISNVQPFKEPTPRSPIHKKSGLPKPNTSLRRSVFKPNVVADFENFVCSTPRNGEPRQLFQDSAIMSPIRSSSLLPHPESSKRLKVRSLVELQTSMSNKSDDGNDGNDCIENRRISIHDPIENVFKIPPAKTSDVGGRRSSVDSVVSKKSKPSSIGEIEPALLQQYDMYVMKTPTKRPTSRLSRGSVSPVSNRSNRVQQVSINMEIDNNDIVNESSRRKSVNQTDYRTIIMAETPVQSNVTTHNRDSMLRMKNKLAICETDDEDEDEAMDEVVDRDELEALDEDIDVYEEEVMYEKEIHEDEIAEMPVYETPKKSQFKRPGTPLYVPMINTPENRKNPKLRLEQITSNSDNDMSNNVSPSLLASFRNLPSKRKSNEKVIDNVDIEITASQPEEASLTQPKKIRKKAKAVENSKKEYVQLATEIRKKNQIKSQDTTIRKRTLYSRDSPSQQQESRCLRSTINTSATSAKENNKSASDIELDAEMSRIHGSYTQKSPVKKAVVASKSKSVMTRSSQKADLLNEQSEYSEDEPEFEEEVENNKTREQNTNSKSKRSQKQQEVDAISKKISYRKVSSGSDSSQDQELVDKIVKEKSHKQQKTKNSEVKLVRKQTQKDNKDYESDCSQKSAPVVITLNTKTRKGSTKKKSVIAQNNEMSFRSFVSEAESSEEEEPFVAPTVPKKSNKKQKDQDSEINLNKEKKSKSKRTEQNVESSVRKSIENKKSKSSKLVYEKPSPLCKKKFSRIVVDDSDSDDEYHFGQNKPQSKVVELTSPQFKVPAVPERKLTRKEKSIKRELDGLKIRFDRELIGDLDEGIDLNDSGDEGSSNSNSNSRDHFNSPGIYRNIYRVADCERKLRVRRLYSRPYWMHGENQFGIRYTTLSPTEELKKKKFHEKQKKCHTNMTKKTMLESCLNITDHQQLIDEQLREKSSRKASHKDPRKPKKQNDDNVSTAYGGSTSGDEQMPTISENSNSRTESPIPEEARSFANLLTRFKQFGKHGSSSNTSEASSSNRPHSNLVDIAQIEDLNFTECGDGVLFGKYVDAVNCGVIQFLEGKKRDLAKTKQGNIKLFMLSGELELTVNTEIHILKPLNFMYIHCGTEYKMRNTYKGVSMVFFLRDDDPVSTKNGSKNSTKQ